MPYNWSTHWWIRNSALQSSFYWSHFVVPQVFAPSLNEDALSITHSRASWNQNITSKDPKKVQLTQKKLLVKLKHKSCQFVGKNITKAHSRAFRSINFMLKNQILSVNVYTTTLKLRTWYIYKKPFFMKGL